MAHTRTWDAAYEQVPSNTEFAKFGAQRIREFKLDIRERMALDHSFAGDNNDGKHIQLTFVNPLGVKPTLIGDEGALYTKTIATISELFWENESGTETQLTSGGEINPAAIRNASSTQDGLVELATNAEAGAKADATRALTPANLAVLFATDAFSGTIEIADVAEHNALSDTTKAVVPGRIPTASTTQRGISELATSTEAYNTAEASRTLTPSSLVTVRGQDRLSTSSGSNATSVSYPTVLSDRTPYYVHRVIGWVHMDTDNTHINLQFTDDFGSTYETLYYGWTQSGYDTSPTTIAVRNQSDSAIRLSYASQSNGANALVSFDFCIYAAQSLAYYKNISGTVQGMSDYGSLPSVVTPPDVYHLTIGGVFFGNTNDLTGFRLTPSSGTMDYAITIYGLW